MLTAPVMSVSASRADAQGADRPTLRFGIDAQDLTTLDPHLAVGTQDRAAVDMIFNGLLRFKPGDASVIEPDLATALPESAIDDETQPWTFTLRDDAMCHPTASTAAYALTSADVVYSLQKAASAETSASAGEYTGMPFAAVGPQIVAVTVPTPLSSTLFLPKFASYQGSFIICQRAYEALGADGFATNPGGTGPFMFGAYTPQTSIDILANDQYYRGAPRWEMRRASHEPSPAQPPSTLRVWPLTKALFSGSARNATPWAMSWGRAKRAIGMRLMMSASV